MTQKNILSIIGNFFLYLFLQIVIFRNFNIMDTAYCFVYINFILLLPFELSPLLIILISCGYGFVIDLFYNTLGINMAASVLIGYLRLHLINTLTPRGGYDTSAELTIASMGIQWMIIYSAVLIFAHHLLLFILEAWGFTSFGLIFTKTIMTTMLSLVVIILFQYLFTTSRRRSI